MSLFQSLEQKVRDYWDHDSHFRQDPLSLFVVLGLREFSKELIEENKVDINKRDASDRNPLEYTLMCREFELADLLISRGATVSHPTVLIITDPSFDARMYSNAIRLFAQYDILPIPIAVGTECIPDVKQFDRDVNDFLKSLPKGVNPCQAILKSGIKEVELIKEFAAKNLKYSDAVWLEGGPNIGQFWYNFSSNNNDAPDLKRDILEIALLELQQNAAYKPLLGVCRGFQMINIFRGGSLTDRGEYGYGALIRKTFSGILARILPQYLLGWSNHKQSIDELGQDLEVVVTSSSGMIKAIQHSSNDLPLLGTQFHPEAVIEDRPNDVVFQNTGKSILDHFALLAHASMKKTCRTQRLKLF